MTNQSLPSSLVRLECGSSSVDLSPSDWSIADENTFPQEGIHWTQHCLDIQNTSSIGLRSGLYGGRNWTNAPLDYMSAAIVPRLFDITCVMNIQTQHLAWSCSEYNVILALNVRHWTFFWDTMIVQNLAYQCTTNRNSVVQFWLCTCMSWSLYSNYVQYRSYMQVLRWSPTQNLQL